MKLSVIIVNYNVKYFLEQCLGSVRNSVRDFEEHYGGGSIEIFIVDNNSVDGSVEMVKTLFPEFRLIANEHNPGFSKANNQAIRISQGEYVLLLNPDTVVENDTFRLCVEFMDTHPDAGGLGIKMIDGKGHFLPESKRGLPTPWVSFYKIFGLARLFPHSRKFGQYHLTYLDKEKTHPVEILSGAFMMLRKSVLDKTGLLDEQFFMYGEDIDLSYRIIKAGYKNYYFPGTSIIHYKGESTKKGSVNYVFVFYRAMILFARKHFSGQHARFFSFFIHLAIYFRGALAILVRWIKRFSLPMIDGALIFGGLVLWKSYWEEYHIYIEGGSYPPELTQIIFPFYTLAWIGLTALSGGYKVPFKISRVLRGILSGTVLILVAYALLPENLRFSRALILLGSANAIIIMLATRIIRHYIRSKNLNFESVSIKRMAIAGDPEECARVEALIHSTGNMSEITGYIFTSGSNAHHPRKLGIVEKLDELVHIYKIQALIFCGKNLDSSAIIHHMARMQHLNLEFKIAPRESEFIIGSNSIHQMGELYVVGLNAVSKPENRRKKRMLDLAVTGTFILFFPVFFLIARNKGGFLKNIWKVLTGRKTWVGYHPSGNDFQLPSVKPGVLTPADAIAISVHDKETLSRLNQLYAKDYSPYMDLNIISRNLGKMGTQITQI